MIFLSPEFCSGWSMLREAHYQDERWLGASHQSAALCESFSIEMNKLLWISGLK